MKTAVIAEDLCIGCNRCLAPCPVDAIVGASGYLHTIIYEACIGCNLCVPHCPAECITMEPIENYLPAEKIAARDQRIAATKDHHANRKQRVTAEQYQATKLFLDKSSARKSQIQANIENALAGINLNE